MLFSNSMTLRYRRFRAHHEHSYPITFFLLGVVRFFLEIAVICAVFLGLVMLVAKVSDEESSFLYALTDKNDTADQQTQVVAKVSVQDMREASQKGTPAELAAKVADAHSALPSLKTNSNSKGIAKVASPEEPAVDASFQKMVVAGAKEGAANAPVASIYDHEWILARPTHHFVIQLASSPRFEKLLDFSGELGENSKLSIFPFKVSASGELVYGISAGEFSSLQLALDAVAGLPTEVRRYSPWVRKVSEVQQDINSVSGRPEVYTISTSGKGLGYQR